MRFRLQPGRRRRRWRHRCRQHRQSGLPGAGRRPCRLRSRRTRRLPGGGPAVNAASNTVGAVTSAATVGGWWRGRSGRAAPNAGAAEADATAPSRSRHARHPRPRGGSGRPPGTPELPSTLPPPDPAHLPTEMPSTIPAVGDPASPPLPTIPRPPRVPNIPEPPPGGFPCGVGPAQKQRVMDQGRRGSSVNPLAPAGSPASPTKYAARAPSRDQAVRPTEHPTEISLRSPSVGSGRAPSRRSVSADPSQCSSRQ